MNLISFHLQIILFITVIMTSPVSSQNIVEIPDLMPMPEEISVKTGEFRLAEDFTIGIKGEAGTRLYKYATMALRRLSGRTGLFFRQDFITPDKNESSPDLLITCNRVGEVRLHEDESYTLTVSESGIIIDSETDMGALRGLETFLQLLNADADGYYFHAVVIKDSPRFAWRGLLIDVGRHFMPVDVIKRNLDAMAAVKLNVLHWHLSEDQGFRVECKAFPKLHEMGSDGYYYTQDQIRDILKYADDRGIRVMPEFDMPGHVSSWMVGYPELASAPGPYEISRRWGVMDPAMDPTKESTYNFLDRFFREMTGLFPDEYFHIGGDENNGKQWNANWEIRRFMEQNDIPDNHALQSYFNKRILELLTKYNKKMVGWDEIFQPDLPTNIVIHSWRGKQAMVDAARRGYQSILSNGYYIDLIRPTDHHYLNDPIPEDSPLTDREKGLILGGEATMWAEYISHETIDSRIWPRTAAIAERFWSQGDIDNVVDMYRRLKIIDLQLEEHGLLHNKNQLMFIRRLCRGYDTGPLKNLIDVIEPMKGYNRGRHRNYRQHSPLTRVVDAAKPDALKAREFRNLVDRYLETDKKNEKTYDEIKKSLILWKNNHTDFIEIIKLSPVLKEIESLSEDLSTVSEIGINALIYFQNGWDTDEKWISESLVFIEKAKEQRGQCELMIIPAIEKLVKAVSGR